MGPRLTRLRPSKSAHHSPDTEAKFVDKPFDALDSEQSYDWLEDGCIGGIIEPHNLELTRGRRAALEAKYAKWKKAQDRERPTVDRDALSEDDKFFADRAKGRAEWIERRTTEGFLWHGGMVGDQYVPAFVEHGLRSHSYPCSDPINLQRIPASTPRAKTPGRKITETTPVLMTGRDKRAVWAGDSKIGQFDDLYLVHEGPRSWWTFRLDSDRVWTTLKDLQEAIMLDFFDGKLACLPHRISWVPDHLNPDFVTKPHIYFDLPWGHGVMREDVGGRRGPVALFKAVLTAVTYATAETLGSDPGGLANPHKGKSALCPFTAIVPDWNTTHYPSLSDWARCPGLDLSRSSEAYARQWAKRNAPIDPKSSNAAFNIAVPSITETLRAAHAAREGWYMSAETRQDMLEPVVERVLPTVAEETGQPVEKLEKLVRSCAAWAISTWSWDIAEGKAVQRGAAAHLVNGVTDLSVRQGIGGAFSRSRVQGKNAQKISDAIGKLQSEGRPITADTISEISGVKVRTVYNHLKRDSETNAQRAATECELKRADPSSHGKPDLDPSFASRPACCPVGDHAASQDTARPVRVTATAEGHADGQPKSFTWPSRERPPVSGIDSAATPVVIESDSVDSTILDSLSSSEPSLMPAQCALPKSGSTAPSTMRSLLLSTRCARAPEGGSVQRSSLVSASGPALPGSAGATRPLRPSE